jgi:hypothetical protein
MILARTLAHKIEVLPTILFFHLKIIVSFCGVGGERKGACFNIDTECYFTLNKNN